MIRKLLNIFQRVVLGEHAADTKLGLPASDPGVFARRLQRMYVMRGGKGFRELPREPVPRREYDDRTRGEEKRRRQAKANAAEVARQRASAQKLIDTGMSKADAYSRFGSLQREVSA